MTSLLPTLRLFVIWLLLAAASWTQEPKTKRLNWKPTDFQPLTTLPWLDIVPNDTAKIVERIFREPMANIRYAVLGEYLRQMPVEQFGMAFDVALMLEGRENPDELVSQMLGIWAERNPQAAWDRTQALAKLVGIDHGWLGYDSWYGERITVQDAEGIQGSRFWLNAWALLSFPDGVESSKLSWPEKLPLLKAFTQFWFDRFQSWPGGGYSSTLRPYQPMSAHGAAETIAMFGKDALDLKHGDVYASGPDAEAAFEVGLRRWLAERPQETPLILERIQKKHWRADGQTPEHSAALSVSLLLLWSQVDVAGLRAWATQAGNAGQDMPWLAKCILMGQVNAATQRQWLAEPQGDLRQDRITELAEWQPELAMNEALLSKDAEFVENVAYGIVGPNWCIDSVNTTHFGLGFMRDFDLMRLSEETRLHFIGETAGILMEYWGNVDVGECARFGLRCLPHGEWPERKELLQFFRGEVDIGDDAILDRTFCSLRIWAVVRPDEMRAWLGTLKDQELRASLTWLLENPWGKMKPSQEEEK